MRVQMGNPRKNPVTDEQIVKAYETERSAYRVAEKLGIGATTVYRVLAAQKVRRDGLDRYRSRITKFKGEEAQLRALYERGATLEQLRERFGQASDYALKHAIKRAGGTLRDDPAPTIQPGELDLIRELNAKGLGQVAISLEIGRSQSFVSRAMRKHGIATQGNVGPRHSMWKGGRVVTGDGYVRVWIEPDDPMRVMALNDGYVAEHRLVMARKLGRPLLRTETVHHINGEKADNRPENLQLRHGRHGKHVVLCCRDCGSHNIGPAPIADSVQ